MGGQEAAVAAEEDRLFTGAGGPADPEGANAGEQAERSGQLVLAFDVVRDLGCVELHCAGDADAVGGGAQGDEPVGKHSVLGADN
jgi:hypothetical protein